MFLIIKQINLNILFSIIYLKTCIWNLKYIYWKIKINLNLTFPRSLFYLLLTNLKRCFKMSSDKIILITLQVISSV